MVDARKTTQSSKKGFFAKFLDMIEMVGNKLPHPVTIFVLFSIAVIIISDIAARAGLSIEFNKVNNTTKEIELTTVQAISLLNADGIRYMFSKAVTNFTGFAPLGTVLVAMLGVGVAEGTGLISALLRKKLVLSTPKGLITAVVVFAGVMSNVVSDEGYGYGRIPIDYWFYHRFSIYKSFHWFSFSKMGYYGTSIRANAYAIRIFPRIHSGCL